MRGFAAIFFSSLCITFPWVSDALAADSTICIAGGDNAQPEPSFYASSTGRCRVGYRAYTSLKSPIPQSARVRPRSPIVGIPYEFHLHVNSETTGWALLRSDGVWLTRIRISWNDGNGHHEFGSEDEPFYSGASRGRRVLSVNGGNVFAWFSEPTTDNPFPVFRAAWSDTHSRFCSKLDVHNQANTLEYFNVPGSCPDGFIPPPELLHPIFDQSVDF